MSIHFFDEENRPFFNPNWVFKRKFFTYFVLQRLDFKIWLRPTSNIFFLNFKLYTNVFLPPVATAHISWKKRTSLFYPNWEFKRLFFDCFILRRHDIIFWPWPNLTTFFCNLHLFIPNKFITSIGTTTQLFEKKKYFFTQFEISNTWFLIFLHFRDLL